jgi:hypothetical protein
VGRTQRACWRAFVAAGGKDLTTSELLAWAYPYGGSKWARWIVRKAARRFAVRVDGGRREAVWRLKDRA